MASDLSVLHSVTHFLDSLSASPTSYDSKISGFRHLRAYLWVYGNLAMSQSLFSGLELLVKRRELLQDFCKVWNLQLACFIARSNWSVFNGNREDNRDYLKCAGGSMQAMAALEAQQLLEMVRALSDALELAGPVVDLADMTVTSKADNPLS
ncbi:hypothetical protein KCV05_g21382, partial [Aureobasidium melanogenum]